MPEIRLYGLKQTEASDPKLRSQDAAIRNGPFDLWQQIVIAPLLIVSKLTLRHTEESWRDLALHTRTRAC
jgi:hypothetical protein